MGSLIKQVLIRREVEDTDTHRERTIGRHGENTESQTPSLQDRTSRTVETPSSTL